MSEPHEELAPKYYIGFVILGNESRETPLTLAHQVPEVGSRVLLEGTWYKVATPPESRYGVVQHSMTQEKWLTPLVALEKLESGV